ncbi:hypothetical protein QH494_05855 [Sphingomonas sp. AR_OL41]|jgi:hypothetical protein|uniref:hypothetical protein n=1 Tax=Sphingomonas sp. AR_OL41 TaxID=3042729 RepID=UPI0024807367|nr:hypothetical protein [Sphingomonas sp. AR_OL41]MDH7971701.1 hypothetical protein [Sphingomonas sp. AR_OL41]
MTIDIRGVFLDAWAMWRRDRGVLLAVAGFFLFMPQLAVLIWIPRMAFVVVKAGENPSPADPQVQAQAMAALAKYGPLMIGANLAVIFGLLVILMLYLDSARGDVRGVMLAALRRLPAYFLLTMMVDAVAILGVTVLYLLLPALYVIGRLLLAGTIFAGARVGPLDAVVRSFRMTRGRGLVLAGFATLILFAGELLPRPALALGDVLDRAPLANPVSALIIDGVAAALITVAMLGGVLVRIALYRRIGASKGI